MTVFRDIAFLAAGPASERSRSAKEGFGVGKALDKFGEFVVTKLYDALIDHADALLTAHWKAW